jgi:RHS repeat-associated protein
VFRVSGETGGHKMGPSLLLKVMSGDKIDLSVQSYYNTGTTSTPVSSVADVLASLASGIVNMASGGKGSITDLNNQTTSPVFTALNSFMSNDPNPTGKPKAYLNWILLDEQLKYVSSSPQSGAIVVGAAGTLNILSNTGIPITKNGYLYIWVSNETPNWFVYFDNLKVAHYTGPELEETHYYPFGLTMAGISSKALKPFYAENKYKYNKGSELQNKEFSDGSGLETYETHFRELDPQLGRWWQTDPKPDYSQSLYSAMGDNPMLHNDPLGDTLIGFSTASAQKMQTTMKNDFAGNKATQSLFKLGKDGKTFKSINSHSFARATKNLSSDKLALATAFMEAINGTSNQVVSLVSRDQNLGSTISGLLPGDKTGADIDSHHGGGVNIPYGKNGTLSVIVTNSTARVGDFVNPATGAYVTQSSSAGELLSHEMLGHGMARTTGSATNNQDAIQMTNMYLRSQGSTLYRDGTNHGGNLQLNAAQASGIPSMYQAQIYGANSTQGVMKLFDSEYN